MITTYNFPGSQSFQCVWHGRSKNDKEAVRLWWKKIHEANGPCAPGGSATLTDAEARKERYRDGQRIYDVVRDLHGNYIQL